MKIFLPFFIVVFLGTLVYSFIFAQEKNNKPQHAMGKLVINTQDGKTLDFTVEIADDYRKRAYGLMFVKNMPEGRGMVFIFDDEIVRNFWMKNTYIPLDILYVGSDLVVKSIASNAVPHSLEMINSIYPAKYVIELNAGLSEKLGIKKGDKIKLMQDKSNFQP